MLKASAGSAWLPSKAMPERSSTSGSCTSPARGVPIDDAEAVRWYRLAAEQGHATAQPALGVMYREGLGVLKDAVIAHMWFNIGDSNGDLFARFFRDNLERDMTPAEIGRATELARTCMASDYQDCGP